MSQPNNENNSRSEEESKEENKLLNSIIYGFGLGAGGVLVGIVIALVLSSILTTNSASTFVSSQLMSSFGYVNASKALSGTAVQYFAYAQMLMFLLPMVSFGILFIVGFLYGRNKKKS